MKKKKEMIPLIDEENELYKMQIVYYIYKKMFSTDQPIKMYLNYIIK